MTTTVKILRGNERDALRNVAPDVFDDPIDEAGLAAFFDDPRHMLGVAIDDGVVVGMVSAVEYFHPDKTAPELWINEVGVSPSHHRRGLARMMLNIVLDEARGRGCAEAWVMTDRANEAAMGLYASLQEASDPSDHVMFSFALR